MQPFRITLALLAAATLMHAGFCSASTRYRYVDILQDRDSGSPGLSLRQAIHDSAPGDGILFNVTGTIILTNELVIDRSLFITGPGARNLVVSGNHHSRVFKVTPSAGYVAISGMTIAYGTNLD